MNRLLRTRPSLAVRISSIAWGLQLLGLATPVLAAGSGMPWEAPLEMILKSVQGPTIPTLTLRFSHWAPAFAGVHEGAALHPKAAIEHA